jgi:hypothetical protein
VLLIEHDHHVYGELSLELSEAVRCDAVCFTPGLADGSQAGAATGT